MTTSSSSFDTCSVVSCWRWWHRCPNKTVVITNKTVIRTGCSSVIYFQVKEQCTVPARIDSQGLVGTAPCVRHILLFTSLAWTQGEINTALWQVSKQLPFEIYWCYPSKFIFLTRPSHSISGPSRWHPLLLLLSPIRVAGSLIDVEPNGSWKRPLSLGCWHCCSDQMIKLRVGDKRRQRRWQRQGRGSRHNGGSEAAYGRCVHACAHTTCACRIYTMKAWLNASSDFKCSY